MKLLVARECRNVRNAWRESLFRASLAHVYAVFIWRQRSLPKLWLRFSPLWGCDVGTDCVSNLYLPDRTLRFCVAPQEII